MRLTQAAQSLSLYTRLPYYVAVEVLKTPAKRVQRFFLAQLALKQSSLGPCLERPARFSRSTRAQTVLNGISARQKYALYSGTSPCSSGAPLSCSTSRERELLLCLKGIITTSSKNHQIQFISC